MFGLAPFGKVPFGGIVPVSESISITAAAGTYNLSGNATTFGNADTGSISVSGKSALFVVAMGPTAGSYSISGKSIAFGASMEVTSGAYGLTGVVSSFSTRLVPVYGSYSLSGVVVTHPVTIAAQAGEYALFGHDAEIHRNIYGTFHASGVANAEFVGTTRFTQFLEARDVRVTYSAEIHLRSLG